MGTLASLHSTSRRSRRRRRPAVNFITIHYAYFVVVCLLGSVVFWASSSPRGSISYVDSLFVVVSAMTEAGLNTVNLSAMTGWQQTILFLLIMLGGTIWVSIWTVVARKHVFRRRLVRASQRLVVAACPAREDLLRVVAPDQGAVRERSSSGSERHGTPPCPHHTPLWHRSAPGAVDSDTTQSRAACGRPCSLQQEPSRPNSEEDGLYGTKSEPVCGCEYRALELLSIVVPLYFLLWQLLGCLGLGAWMYHHMPGTALANGINPWWLGVFNGVSAFNNSGMSLLDANMMPFQEAYFVLITMGLMILAGNTAYPIFLRLIFWLSLKLLDLTTEAAVCQNTKLAIKVLLEDPRRVYTNLFPSRPTWWLSFMLVCLNTIDWVLFELLNLNNPVIGRIPVGPRILVGLFQALAVRSGGFYVVPIAQISIGVQFIYVVMMYISVYPVVITMRQSSVYTHSLGDVVGSDSHDASRADLHGLDSAVSHPIEKQSLATGHEAYPPVAASSDQTSWRARLGNLQPTTPNGQPASQTHARAQEERPSCHTRLLSLQEAPPPATYGGHLRFIHQQIHGQLAKDIWWLVLAVLLIVIIESSQFDADPINHSVFNIIFEVASAYGTVGISVGTPNGAYSFAGTWFTGSKLILCLVMLRGRHRGLPTALDHAIRLPQQHSNCSQNVIEDKQMGTKQK